MQTTRLPPARKHHEPDHRSHRSHRSYRSGMHQARKTPLYGRICKKRSVTTVNTQTVLFKTRCRTHNTSHCCALPRMYCTRTLGHTKKKKMEPHSPGTPATTPQLKSKYYRGTYNCSSNQDLKWCVKIVVYMVFWVHSGF